MHDLEPLVSELGRRLGEVETERRIEVRGSIVATPDDEPRARNQPGLASLPQLDRDRIGKTRFVHQAAAGVIVEPRRSSAQTRSSASGTAASTTAVSSRPISIAAGWIPTSDAAAGKKPMRRATATRSATPT